MSDLLERLAEDPAHQDAAEIARLRAALKWYADQFCEYDASFDGCGKLSDDICSGCKARAALQPVR
jgi:hypothetical protein